MRKTLRMLIEEEHFAVSKLEDCGRDVEYYAEEINFFSDIPDSPFADERKARYEDAIQKRDAALQELASVRSELKQYLLTNILN